MTKIYERLFSKRQIHAATRLLKYARSSGAHWLFATLILLAFGASVQAQTFPVEIETLPRGKKIIITYKAKVVKPLDPLTTLTVSDQAFLSADGYGTVFSNDPETQETDDATITSVLGCNISSIVASAPVCGNDNRYSVDVTVTQTGDAPITGNLVIEAGGETFETPVEPNQTAQLLTISLPANGDTIDVRAYYSELPECTLSVEDLFVAPRGCAIIGNRVWEDLNGDGIQNDGSGGIPNVAVSLLDCSDQPITQTLTDLNGNFRFTELPPGAYKIRYDLSTASPTFADAVFTTQNATDEDADSDVNPMTNETPCFDLLAGEQNFDWDAGLYVPGEIGNFTWVDQNRNNVFNSGLDAPLGGITVRLYNCSDPADATPIATQTTGANGRYLFSNLPPGSYKVQFSFPPTGVYERVVANIGSDATDSDVEFDGFTGCYTIQSRGQDLSVDAGYTFCPPGTDMVCRGSINVNMGESCEIVVTPGMLLTMAPPCPDTYEVRIRGENGRDIGNTLTSEHVGKTLQATVIDSQTGNSCATDITIFDQRDPEITCPPNTNKAQYNQEVQLIVGTLASLLSSDVLSGYSCFEPIVEPGGGEHYYEMFTFTVTENDVYTFEMSSEFDEGGALLFLGDIRGRQLSCQNLLAQSYKSFTTGIYFSDLNPITRITQQLRPGETYTLVTTSRTPETIGAYFWAAYSDGDGLIPGIQPIETQASYDLICNDINQILDNPQSLAFVGSPIATDNCENPVADVTFEDELVEGNECSGDVITRTFTATDPSGNTAQCSQIISVRKPTLADVIYPRLTVFLECDGDFEVDINGNPHPDATGYPIVKTAFGNHALATSYCNITATYVDKPRTEGCGENFGFIREWTIVDFCNTANILTFNQTIRVGDSEPPTVSCPTSDLDNDGVLDTLVFSTTSFSCEATFDVPAPIISDNCSSSTFKVEILSDTLALIRDEFGFIIGEEIQTITRAVVQSTGSLQVSNIPIGEHRFRYIVTDDCGNETVLECPFKVEDRVEPVVVCQNDLTISLGGDGSARIFATDVDEGSRDNCGIDSILIRRRYTRDPATCDSVAPYFSPWSEFVDIGCCDTDSSVYVEVRVIDKFGNANECIVNVVVTDMLRPFCIAPPPVSITCTSLPDMFDPTDTTQLRELFGEATATDNCIATWEELEPTVNLDDCGVGNIVRRFRTTDLSGNTSINTCQQIITITDINNYEIKFPKDTDVQCEIISADTISLNAFACDQMSVSVSEDIFSPIGEECYRIFRTYRVINFCEYDGVSPPIVIGRDEDCDNRAGEEDVWVLRRPNNTFIDRNNAHDDSNPAANQRGCTPTNPGGYWRTSESRGYWQYTQIIRVYDTIAPEVMYVEPSPFCSTSDDCIAPVNIPFVVTEGCTPNAVGLQVSVDIGNDGALDGNLADFGATLSGVYPNYQVNGTFQIGQHALRVRATDDCGNERIRFLPFEIADCKAPEPVCFEGRTVNLSFIRPPADADDDGLPDLGAAIVRVEDLVDSVTQDCSGAIRFSINRLGEFPDINRDTIVVTCEDLESEVFLEVYAWDSATNPFAIQPSGIIGGPNYSFCVTSITVTDTLGACIPPREGQVTGIIKTENNNPVEGVSVSLSGQSAATTTTTLDGTYSFKQLAESYDYTVTPHFDENHRNGVSTLDLILITRHILGVEPLNTPYKMIAADVNASKNISILDLIEIRKLILGIDLAFAGNTSWRFIRSSYNFPVQTNPWFEEYPEVISINDLDGTMGEANFVAVKIGDMNLSAVTSQEELVEASPRSSRGTFAFQIVDRELRAGETYTVDVEARIADVQGYQLTFAFDPQVLQLEGVEYGRVREEHFGLHLADQGFVTTSWHELLRQRSGVLQQAKLFSFVFRARRDGRLSEQLRVSSRYTSAEAYNAQDEPMPVEIDFRMDAGAQPKAFALYQNVPNPFSRITLIEFYLPEAAQVHFAITDAGGRAWKTIQARYEAGHHTLEIDSRELPSGVLYYQLKTGKYQASRKMVILR